MQYRLPQRLHSSNGEAGPAAPPRPGHPSSAHEWTALPARHARLTPIADNTADSHTLLRMLRPTMRLLVWVGSPGVFTSGLPGAWPRWKVGVACWAHARLGPSARVGVAWGGDLFLLVPSSRLAGRTEPQRGFIHFEVLKSRDQESRSAKPSPIKTDSFAISPQVRHRVFHQATKAGGGVGWGWWWRQESPHISVPFPSNSGVLKSGF